MLYAVLTVVGCCVINCGMCYFISANCCVINNGCGIMFIGCANCCVINKAVE